MQNKAIVRSFVAVLAVTACNQAGNVQLDDVGSKGSYAIGVQMYSQMSATGAPFDFDAMRAGIRDAAAGGDLMMTDEEMAQAFQDFQQAAIAGTQEQAEAQGAENRAAGQAFLAENGAREGVVTTPSGLQYEVLQEGAGPKPQPDNRVQVRYMGTLIDGTVFDQNPGVWFRVGGVIPGFAEGIQLMSVGAKYKLYIPGDIGYGLSGSGPLIGPNATLIFEVELLGIE